MLHRKQIELLKLLRDATRKGLATWKRDRSGSHQTKLAGLEFSLRFKYPLLAGDEGSDADAVEIRGAQTIWTEYAGSEGFGLVNDILTAAFPELREHNGMIEARLEKAIKRVQKTIG